MLTAANIFTFAISSHFSRCIWNSHMLRERQLTSYWFLYRLEFPDPLDLYVEKFENVLSSVIFIGST